MANLRYRFILHFASFLFLIGLFVSISPVLAESVNVPSSNELSPCEQGKETIIKAEEIIEALDKEGGELDYSDCIVVGDLDFFILSKEKDTETGEYFINITRPLKFSKTVFKGRISTVNRSIEIWNEPRVNFSSKIDFTATSFEDAVIFDNAVFKENVTFERAHFHKWVSFKKSTFKKFAHFHSAQFDNIARFDNIQFENNANFAYTTFNSLAFFHRAKFLLPESEWGANFLFTRFNRDSIFSNTHFASNANFIYTQFHGRSYFSNSTFDNQACFSGVLFDDDVTFKDAKFLKNSPISRKEGGAPREPVFFGGVVFSGNAVFSNVIFGRVAFCDVGTEVDTGINTIFQKKADFRDATFGTLNLRGAIFQSTVDFSGAVFRGWVNFTNVDIESASINLKWNQLLDEHKKWFFFNEVEVKFYSDDSFLSTLKKKFEENMQPDDAGKVRYLKADKTYVKKRESGSFRDWLYLILDYLFLRLCFGYGVNPWQQLYTSLFLIFLFTLLYMPPNALQYDQTRKNKSKIYRIIKNFLIDFPVEKEMLVSPDTKIMKPKSFFSLYLKGFYFSFFIFTKIGFTGLYYSGKYRWAVILEWIFGFIFWALFLYNISNVFPPIYRLITMLG